MTDADHSPEAPAARPLRVLYLNPFSQQVSGPDESLITLLGGLIPLGVEPHVVLPRPGPQVSRYEALGARVHYAPLTFLKRRLGPAALALLPLRLVRSVLAVVRIARRERIDLIHTNMEVVLDGAFAARLLRIPHVLHYRGNTLDRPKLVFDVLTRFWTATADKVLCISNATAEIFRKRGLGAKVQALYNAVDVGAFAAARRDDGVRSAPGQPTPSWERSAASTRERTSPPSFAPAPSSPERCHASAAWSWGPAASRCAGPEPGGTCRR